MQIVDLTDEHLESYLACLEEWSDDIKEGGNHKRIWFDRVKDKGLRVKLALDDRKACGMIHYLPIEESFAEGSDLYFVLCIWVHGHKQGVGNYQKRGIGTMLLAAAEEDARSRGAKGIAAWGISLPLFMRASWFKKHGYRKVDNNGMQILLWKPFTSPASPPKWIKERKLPGRTEGRVSVTTFLTGWCPAMNMAFERAKRACSEFGECAEFQAIDTLDRSTYLEWGIADALFVDGKRIRTGPPPSYEKIRRKIARRVKKLKRETENRERIT